MDFIRRHKKKILFGTIGTLVIGGIGYAGYRFYSERQRRLEEQNTLTKRMRHLFEENRKTSYSALFNMIPKLMDRLQEIYNVEGIIDNAKKVSSEERRDAFNQMKLQSFTRTIASVYSLSLLHLFLSVQVNIIGRYLFIRHIRESKKARTQQPEIELDVKTQEQFLSMASHFQDEGIARLAEMVQQVVEKCTADLNLKKVVAPNDMFTLIEEIREQIETQFFDQAKAAQTSVVPISTKMSEILLSDSVTYESPQVNALVDELRELVESVQFVNVFREACNSSFSVLYRRIENMMHDEEQATAQMRVANFIPKLGKETKKVLSKGREMGPIDNEYVWSVHETLTLNKYLVMVYSHGVVIE
jgi:peroxin-3